ncbi:unnamed protein product [Auanema sp. JU1783]|nr:unnamed protein product [Auanema sp. JU1783]
MMNWQYDPCILKLLEKTTLESLFKEYFKTVYGKDKVQEMENALRNALNRYENKNELFEKLVENKENEAEPLNSGKNHTPESMLTLSRIFIKVGDYRLACEVLWCTVFLDIQEFISSRQLLVFHDVSNKDASKMFDF